MTEPGTVYLIGAGPGDPDLITVKGLRCLRKADVVVYDRLANADLLAEAPMAKRIYVGKVPGRHIHSQQEINSILLREAIRGKSVVRLKGGDPFVFGRGGEECQSLARAGIPFEIVPGISSALAVPAYAGIPVTQRGVAGSFTVVSGHGAGDGSYAIDRAQIPEQGTLVILMGVRYLAQIAADLIAYGRSPNTPLAVIERGAGHEQITTTATLDTVGRIAPTIRPPAIIVVGNVVDLAADLDWFEPTREKLPEPIELDQAAEELFTMPIVAWRNS